VGCCVAMTHGPGRESYWNPCSEVPSPPYVLARLSPDRTADQFPIWDHIARVDGSVSVALKTVDVDRVAGIVWWSVETKKQIA
jgi:hypothetical protein